MWVHTARYWADLIYVAWVGAALFAVLVLTVWERVRRK